MAESSETKKGSEIPADEDLTVMSSRFKDKTDKGRRKNSTMKTQEQERQHKKMELEQILSKTAKKKDASDKNKGFIVTESGLVEAGASSSGARHKVKEHKSLLDSVTDSIKAGIVMGSLNYPYCS